MARSCPRRAGRRPSLASRRDQKSVRMCTGLRANSRRLALRPCGARLERRSSPLLVAAFVFPPARAHHLEHRHPHLERYAPSGPRGRSVDLWALGDPCPRRGGMLRSGYRSKSAGWRGRLGSRHSPGYMARAAALAQRPRSLGAVPAGGGSRRPRGDFAVRVLSRRSRLIATVRRRHRPPGSAPLRHLSRLVRYSLMATCPGAVQVAVGPTGSSLRPDRPSSMVDLEAADDGTLMPRLDTKSPPRPVLPSTLWKSRRPGRSITLPRVGRHRLRFLFGAPHPRPRHDECAEGDHHSRSRLAPRGAR